MTLKIHLSDIQEMYDEVNEVFVYNEQNVMDLELEHSLATISVWESKWHKAFLGKKEKTNEEMLDYIKCMVVNREIDDAVVQKIVTNLEIYEKVVNYINDSMTATYFREDNTNRYNNETTTSELIYYWMIALQIPVEFEHWHLNRLMTLIRVCNVKNTPPKKRSAQQIMRDNSALNAARRAKMGTKG